MELSGSSGGADTFVALKPVPSPRLVKGDWSESRKGAERFIMIAKTRLYPLSSCPVYQS